MPTPDLIFEAIWKKTRDSSGGTAPEGSYPVAVALLIEFILLQVKFRPTSFTQTSPPLTHLRRLIKYSSGKFPVQFSITGRRFFPAGSFLVLKRRNLTRLKSLIASNSSAAACN
jgi:hypothetical protein